MNNFEIYPIMKTFSPIMLNVNLNILPDLKLFSPIGFLASIVIKFSGSPGLILHGGNGGDCLRCPLPLPWCPWNAPVEIYNFLIGCPLPKRKCLGALALSKTKHTALAMYVDFKNRNEKYFCIYLLLVFYFILFFPRLQFASVWFDIP